MKYFLFTALTLFVLTAFSQTEIKLEDVKDHIGDSVKLQAKIYGGIYIKSAKGKPTFLNVGGNYPKAPLTLVIWDDVRKKFQDAPEKIYKEMQVFITGKLFLYKDKPEITIYSPEQLLQVIAAPIEKQ